MKPRTGRRAPLWRVVIVTLLLAARVATAQSLAQPLSLLQQSHWTEKHGLPVPNILTIQRSPDGYLWLGSAAGLIRFDGVRFVVMDSTTSPAFRASKESNFSLAGEGHAEAARRSFLGLTLPLLVDRAGVLWIGPPDGSLLKYVDGVFSVVLRPDPHVGRINRMVQDGTGKLWVIASGEDRVFLLHDGRLNAPPLPKGVPQVAVTSIIRDRGDGIWIGVHSGRLWHVVASAGEESRSAPGPALFLRPMLEARDGALWVMAGGRTYRVCDNVWRQVVSDSSGQRVAYPTDIAEMPDGAVVVSTRGDGLIRWKNGKIDRLAEQDGLSSASAQHLLLDAEGSLWVATDAGLDRFRAAPFTTISARNGLPLVSPASLQLDGDGSIWVMTSAGSGILQKLDADRLLEREPAVLGRAGRPQIDTFVLPFATLPGNGVLLLENHGGLARQERGRTLPLGISGLPTPPSTRPTGALMAHDGALWLSFRPKGFGAARDRHYVPLALPELATHRVESFAEDAHGHMWVALRDTALVLELADDRVVRRFDRQSGISEPLQLLATSVRDTVWGAGAATGALFRLSGATATAFALPAAARVFLGATPVLIPTKHDLWFASTVGIGRVSYAALRTPVPLVQLFDALDGLTAGRIARLTTGGAVTDRKGRIWFSTLGGLSVVSPQGLRTNDVTPRVHIEEVRVHDTLVVHDTRQSFDIPPNAGRLDIHFTAPALLVPERVRIEYQLVGTDPSWVDGSAQRMATYTQLRPGNYRFRVRAWNEDGVPSANEASLSFTVLPAWYQTWWFAALAVLAVAGLGSGAAYTQQRARARSRETFMRSRFEATLEERTRVARELHDTVLSGFTGITFQLQALHQTMVESPQLAADTLARVLSSADAALREAREMIWDMRGASEVGNDFATTLESTARAAVVNTPIDVRMVVHGERRDLTVPIETTLLRVSREAIINTVKHAGAHCVTLELTYSTDRVTLCISDDGCGIAPAAAEVAITAGHWGLSNMRERALRVGGTLSVDGRSGEGTTITISVPID